MRQAAYRLIAIGLALPTLLVVVFLVQDGHPGKSLGIFGLVFVLPFSLIFLVMGALRLIQAVEDEAKPKKGSTK